MEFYIVSEYLPESTSSSSDKINTTPVLRQIEIVCLQIERNKYSVSVLWNPIPKSITGV
jgi:hypothetical protein